MTTRKVLVSSSEKVATTRDNAESIGFIERKNQAENGGHPPPPLASSLKQILEILFNEMNPDNVIADAELNDDGLYEVQVTKDISKALTVSVFPRVGTNTLSQAVYLLHASLSHMSKDGMIALARSSLEEQRNCNPMVKNWPSAISPNVIRDHFPQCKACLMANQKKLPFF